MERFTCYTFTCGNGKSLTLWTNDDKMLLKTIAAFSIFTLKVRITRAPDILGVQRFLDKTVYYNVTAAKRIKDSVYHYLC